MELVLAKLFGDGCVLQSDMPVTIWGWGVPGSEVVVEVQHRRSSALVDATGAWQVVVEPLMAGGPFELSASDGEGGSLRRTCYVGEVFLCGGQSNMELPMSWVSREYPEEFSKPDDPLLRQYKVSPRYDFQGPVVDHEEGSWSGVDADHLGGFSAVAYFFGRALRRHLGVPVGLMNVSLGGSPIESWMDRETLSSFPSALEVLNPYLGDGVAEAKSASSLARIRRWHDALELRAKPEDELSWHDIELPNAFDCVGLSDWNGVLELRKTIHLRRDQAGMPAMLRLGTMADADETWMNGRRLGGHDNRYELRDYRIDENVLREGTNEIRVRLTCEHGSGRVTPGKRLELRVDGECVDLSGAWRYAVATQADTECPYEDFVRWKPTGLYNAMLSVCTRYALRAVLWYQGESNTGDGASEYRRMLTAMIGLWRRRWNQDRLPFLIVQLPNIDIDCVEDGGWPVVREAQWQVSCDVDDVATVVALDVGERNDLHPVRKRPIGEQLCDAALQLVYGEDVGCSQPCLTDVCVEGDDVVLSFANRHISQKKAGGASFGPITLSTVDGRSPGEFSFHWDDGLDVPTEARIDGCHIRLRRPNRRPDEIRYAWRNNPERGLLCNERGSLLTPLRVAFPRD
ncbi:sialate O-acetylesterase [Bifidobacterium lemurum]|nr:sialate O-acetylesterase [Bifidobacterium lemurum]QOL34636.1 9-O-acetylesterase [Bifidobacterium lemurum]